MAELLKVADQFILENIIREKIRLEGPISFCDFMEACLYDPQHGYYTSGNEKIGRAGDYYTSPYATPIFGKILARQLEEMWRILGIDDFTIVEIGGGNGLLCADILNELSDNDRLFKNLSYYIIEKRERTEYVERLSHREKIRVLGTISELPEISGCIFSNELVDNFPVHRVIMQDDLMEVFVDYRQQFVETLRPADAILKNYFDLLEVQLDPGFQTEINLSMVGWMEELAAVLKKGFVMTIDYGCSSAELYSNKKRNGTLACYKNHGVHFNPYINLGTQDITAHVNFSAIKKWGLDIGLQFTGYTDQAHFLKALGLTGLIREEEKKKNFYPNQISFFLHSFLIEMGSRIKILIQQKKLRELHLSGLQFAHSLV